MARWHRYRPAPDYSHLVGSSLDSILDGAIRNRRYGRDRRTYPAEVNEALIHLFDGHDGLSRTDLKKEADRLRAPQGWSAEHATDRVGNWISWGMHLGLLCDDKIQDRQRVWTMPDREPRYAVLAGEAVQIRGLPPEAQDAMDRRLRASAKRSVTMARRHAAILAPAIAHDLSAILEEDFAIPIPSGWSPHYVPADIAGRWPMLKESFGLLLDVHRDWDKGRQNTWRAMVARTLVETRKRVAEERAAQAILDAALDEDVEAFADLEDI